MATIIKNATGTNLTLAASWADSTTPVPYWVDINHGGGEVKTVLRHPTTGGYFVGGAFGIRYIAPDGTITNGPTFSGGTATVHDIMWAQSLPGVTTAGIVVAGTFTTVTVGGVASTRHQIAVLSPAMTTLYGAAQTMWSNGAVYTLCATSWTTNYTNLMFVGGDFSYTPPCTNCATARVEENLSHFTLSADLSTLTYRRHADSSGSDSSAAHAFIGTSSEYASPCVLKVVSSGANVYIFGDFTTYGYRKYGSFPNYARNGAAAFTITSYAANPTLFLEFNPQAWAPSFASGIPYTAAVAPEGIYVGGSFQSVSGQGYANIALVSSTVTATSILACASANGKVHDIKYYDGPSGDGAVIAGEFTSPRRYVAMINGSAVMGWKEERSTPRASPVKALATTSGLIFAGGSGSDQSSEQKNISNFTVSSATPTSADDTIWKSWSLGGTYSGNLSANSITFDGAHGNITHPSGSTITIGSGGWTFGPDNINSWDEYGTINVGSTNQTWALSNSIRTSTIRLYGNLTGSAKIDITNNSGINDFGYAYIISNAANAGFNGTLALQNYTGVAPISAGVLTQAKIQVDGDGCFIWPGNASGDTIGSSTGLLTVNNNVTLGWPGRSFTIASPVQAGSTKRTLSIGGATTLTSHISGTAGLAVNTTGSIVLSVTGPQSSISGPLDLESNTGGYGMLIGNATGTPNQLSNITELNLNGAIYYDGNSNYTEDAILNATGPRAALISRGIMTLSDPSQSTFGGELWCQSNVGAHSTAQMTLNHPPEDATRFRLQVQGVTSQTGYNGRFIFNNAIGSVIPGPVDLSLNAVATQAAGAVGILEDNSSGNTFTGTVSGAQTSTAFLNLGLQGSSTGSVLSGSIATGAATMGLVKSGSGTWVVKGNNNHTGTNSITAGTLSLQSTSALGSSAAGVVTQTGGTIEVTGGTALNKGSQTLTLVSAGGATALKATSGTNSIACGGVTLNSTLPVDVSTSASLTINNTTAISGAGMGITKIGGGELVLGSSGNTYTGPVTVSEGILTAQTIAAAGSNSSLGTGGVSPLVRVADTLKVVGGGGTTNRPIVLQSTNPALDASGAGTVTYSELSQFDNGERTITLKGSNTGDNTISGEIKSSGMHRTTGMITARGRHGSVLLTSGSNSGKILAIGGAPGGSGNALSSCELFDPTTNTWTAANSMSSARWICEDNIVTLNTGEVFIAGSQSTSTNTSALSTTEIYNPDTGIWRAGATMLSSSLGPTRSGASLTLLGDGKVLLVGGFSSTSAVHTNCQIFTPPVAGSGTGSWTSVTSALPTGRFFHATARLSNGNVLIIGGYTGTASINDCRVFSYNSSNPAASSWSATTNNLSTPRHQPTAIPINGGTRILVAGGYNSFTSSFLKSCEIYNVSTNSWSPGPNMFEARLAPSWTVLSDGKILVAGGAKADWTGSNTCEIFDPTNDTWTLIQGSIPVPVTSEMSLLTDLLKDTVWLHKSNALSDGRILFSGGYDGNATVTNICTIYNPPHTVNLVKSGPGKWITAGTLTHSGTTTVSGGVLNLGGAERILTGGISISDGTLENGSAAIFSDVTASGGSIRVALAGSGKTLDITSGEVYLYPPFDSSYTGGTTIDSSAVLTVKTDSNPSVAGTGTVLGSGSTIVDGELRTAAGGDQKGKLRYGGSLSFGAGAKLHIGSAA